jgi:outer membrane immunogenic protein
MKDWGGINFPASGVFGGGQVGFNRQAGNLVFGLEAEAFSGMKGSRFELIEIPFSVSSFHQTIASKIDAVESAALRLGVAVDRWLVYGKGGLAWAQERHTTQQLSTITGIPGAQTVNISGHEQRRGWLAGAGAEYAFFGNWSAKLEYNWIHFYDQQVYLPGTFTEILPARGTATGTLPTSATLGSSLQLVKLGINYRFGPDVIKAKF